MVVEQLSDFMIIVLLAAAVVAGVVGEPKDSLVIIVIVTLNAIIGVAQEWRAERALEVLRQMTAPSARILRDGEQRVVTARDLVPATWCCCRRGTSHRLTFAWSNPPLCAPMNRC
jgi:Ca2+-transporting ATPase